MGLSESRAFGSATLAQRTTSNIILAANRSMVLSNDHPLAPLRTAQLFSMVQGGGQLSYHAMEPLVKHTLALFPEQ